MGLASLLSDPNLSPTKAPTADCINTKLLLGRLSVLVGLRFNDGVDENGMSPFHYPIADLLPVLCVDTVSYTHLTLPTKRIVQISVVEASLKKKKNNKVKV
eukprot:TRINITY_DN36446_c0_g1_i1.p1 TRINITY_DN36446_c0_g1~~TRINITY_DN36446_c0_g1_i1.p1  ORF type:complete len:101 (+),score=25.58 TRINITY_DN36446_c0_g1_i1:146-448(+)